MYKVSPVATQRTSKPYPLPAPVGGWNARDSITSMKPTDAIQLDNMFPTARNVQSRKGSILFATLPVDTDPLDPHNIRSLMSYNPSSGTPKLFAACEDGIYEATAGGTISSVSSAATSGEWQHTMISNAAGTFLWCCNGVDDCRYYTGSAWVVLTGASTPAITGIVSTDVTNVSLFKSRLYLCEKASLSFWYLGVNSINGAASEFPLGALFPRGGYLMATASWTFDGGSGPDDYFAAITSEGELVLYQGTDPSNSATWALVGVFFIGKPLGRRCFVKLGGDLAVQTVQGLQPLSKVLQSATLESSESISNKIESAWVTSSEKGKDLFGWQPIVFPSANMLLVNVPVLNAEEQNIIFSYQFVMNTQTKAWCRFAGMSAEVWGIHDDKLYFAVHNKIYQAWVGAYDESFGPIDVRVRQAYFTPTGGSIAQVKLLQPLFEITSTKISVQMGIDVDYNDLTGAFSSVTYAEGISYYDEAEWDEAKWTGSLFNGEWRAVSHNPGKALSLRLRFFGRGVTLTWNATNLVLQQGSIFS